MSRSDRFPDIKEFRSRLKTMGFSTGADDRQAASAPVRTPSPRAVPAGAMALWSCLAAISVAVLVWLAYDLGGPGRAVVALKDAGAERGDVLLLRGELRRALQGAPSLTASVPPAAATRPDEALLQRIAALETRLAEREAQLDPLASGPGSLEQSSTASGQRRLKVGLVPKGEDRPPTSPRHALPGAGPPDTVAAVTPAPGSGAERSRLASTDFGLDLGAYESIAVMKDRWSLLEGRHRDLLEGLQPRRITEFGADGRVAYRLVAAPVADAFRIAELCAALQARGIPCRQTVNAGEPL